LALPGLAELEDGRKVAVAQGIDEIFGALEKADVKLPSSTDTTSANKLTSITSGPVDANEPWRKSYEELHANLSVQMSADGKPTLNWGKATDFGAWYEKVGALSVTSQRATRAPERSAERRTLQQQVEALERDVAQASSRLAGVEWSAVVKRISGSDVELDLPRAPSPVFVTYEIKSNDLANWSNVKLGDRIHFACEFTTGASPGAIHPIVKVQVTLKPTP
jgi:hypothetical protein